MTGWPVGFLSYQIRTEREKEHTVKILFDVDTEWMFGKREVNSWVEQGWRFTKSDSLYLAMRTDETRFSYEDNHIILSQKLCSGKEDRGVLLIGYKEGQTLQYGGENLRPLWNNDEAKEVKELMKSVGNRCQELRQESEKLDYKWNDKALQVGGETLAEYILPAYRNFYLPIDLYCLRMINCFVSVIL